MAVETIGDALRSILADVAVIVDGPSGCGRVGSTVSASDSLFAIHRSRHKIKQIRRALAQLSTIMSPWGPPDGRISRQVLAELSSVAAIAARHDAMKVGLQGMVGAQAVLQAVRSIFQDEMSRQAAIIALEPVVRATESLIAEGHELELSAAAVDDGGAAVGSAEMEESDSASSDVPNGYSPRKIEITIGHSSFALELQLSVTPPKRHPETELLGETTASWDSASFLVLYEAARCSISGGGSAGQAPASTGASGGAEAKPGAGDGQAMEDGGDDDDDDDGVLSADHLDESALATARAGAWEGIYAMLLRELSRHAVATGMFEAPGTTVPLLPHVDEGLLAQDAGVGTGLAFCPDGVEARTLAMHGAWVDLSSPLSSEEVISVTSGRAQSMLVIASGKSTSSSVDPVLALEAGAVCQRGAEGELAMARRACSGVVAYGTRPSGIGAAMQLRAPIPTTPSIARMAGGSASLAVGAGGGASAASAAHAPSAYAAVVPMGLVLHQKVRDECVTSGWARCMHLVGMQPEGVPSPVRALARIELLTWAGLCGRAGSSASSYPRTDGSPSSKRARVEEEGKEMWPGTDQRCTDAPFLRSIDLGLVRPARGAAEAESDPVEWSKLAGAGLEPATRRSMIALEAAQVLGSIVRSAAFAASCIVGPPCSKPSTDSQPPMEQDDSKKLEPDSAVGSASSVSGPAVSAAARCFAWVCDGEQAPSGAPAPSSSGGGSLRSFLAEIRAFALGVTSDDCEASMQWSDAVMLRVRVLQPDGATAATSDGAAAASVQCEIACATVSRTDVESWTGTSEGRIPAAAAMNAAFESADGGGTRPSADGAAWRELGTGSILRNGSNGLSLWSLPRCVAAAMRI